MGWLRRWQPRSVTERSPRGPAGVVGLGALELLRNRGKGRLGGTARPTVVLVLAEAHRPVGPDLAGGSPGTGTWGSVSLAQSGVAWGGPGTRGVVMSLSEGLGGTGRPTAGVRRKRRVLTPMVDGTEVFIAF
ncbi:hypothetical protein NDU88_000103 [Pleurodeles waltl]|uniref:Uncharacterized protein n=1 Tax=Pleurodeles waltl TaxID=8319 RepID=A0AAV7SVH9_PLEWA|nr:hypothetical protein NDU88_000103 [Pleurodeles waltl]